MEEVRKIVADHDERVKNRERKRIAAELFEKRIILFDEYGVGHNVIPLSSVEEITDEKKR